MLCAGLSCSSLVFAVAVTPMSGRAVSECETESSDTKSDALDKCARAPVSVSGIVSIMLDPPPLRCSELEAFADAGMDVVDVSCDWPTTFDAIFVCCSGLQYLPACYLRGCRCRYVLADISRCVILCHENMCLFALAGGSISGLVMASDIYDSKNEAYQYDYARDDDLSFR